ncbi:MAG: AraC family transcriptional regulator [Cytophagales bacterium]|nr:AraC family transcriptional regulator [Cytophagales bacterium]MDW8384421.1 AraC family transcriptional regulator [Flammeovirgaceae bacterium]
MEDYNKIIESLFIKFVKLNMLEVIQPVNVTSFYDVQNTLILLNAGNISLGNGQEMSVGEALFIPGGKLTPLTLGSDARHSITNEELIENHDKYLRAKHIPTGMDNAKLTTTVFTKLTFEAKAFDSVNFFTKLDIPPFIIRNYATTGSLIRKIHREVISSEPGRNRLIHLFTEEIVIDLIRYILSNQMFVEKLATNNSYFKDPRLIQLFNFIKENLAGDLSNKVLSRVANVSEDYVGQYFKSLTGINPQDYIEYQRMEKAVMMLRTTKKSIRAISSEVGYKDTAYFCRRFKMMFGIPAGKMRRRESLIDNI